MIRLSILIEALRASPTGGQFVGNVRHQRILDLMKGQSWIDYVKIPHPAGNSYRITHNHAIVSLQFYKIPWVSTKHTGERLLKKAIMADDQYLILTSPQGLRIVHDTLGPGIVLGKVRVR